MGLRQSKRSVDITSTSPKKEAAAAASTAAAAAPEKAAADAATIEKIDEESKTPVNGEAKTAEPAEPVIIILAKAITLC